MKETIGQNYSSQVEFEKVRKLGYVGDVYMDSLMVGSADPGSVSPSIESFKISTNCDLLKGYLKIKLMYRTTTGIWILECIFVEVTTANGPILELMVLNHKCTSLLEVSPLRWGFKKTNDQWSIVITHNGQVTCNNYSLSYELSSSQVIGPMNNAQATTYVDILPLATVVPADWDTKNQPVGQLDKFTKPDDDIIPKGAVIPWWPSPDQLDELESVFSLFGQSGTSESYISSVYLDTLKSFIPSGWVLVDGEVYDNSDVRFKTPDIKGKHIVGLKYDDNKLPRSLSQFNDTTYRDYTVAQSTTMINDGVAYQDVKSNYGAIGNEGGKSTVKLLPKQQGALRWAPIGCRLGENGHRETIVGGINVFWTKDGGGTAFNHNTTNIQSGGSINGLDAPSGGRRNNPARTWYVTENASEHENKPPYIVMALIMKMHAD